LSTAQKCVNRTKRHRRPLRPAAGWSASAAELVTLDAHDFDRYVMDDWDWSRFALATNTAYAAETPHAPGKWKEEQ